MAAAKGARRMCWVVWVVLESVVVWVVDGDREIVNDDDDDDDSRNDPLPSSQLALALALLADRSSRVTGDRRRGIG